jgi:Ala-tRNA(Pro) deacylase
MNDTEHKVKLVIDHDLLNDEAIGCHPCVNTATLRLTLRDLLDRFVPATCHDYQVVELASE